MNLDELDYWARQKIEQGYLYRIESSLSVYELAQLLKSKLSEASERVVSFESGVSGLHHRYVSIAGDMVMQELYVQPQLLDTDISSIVGNFNRQFDSTMESVYRSEPPLAG